MKKTGKLYYGWKIVICAFMCLFFGQILYTNCMGIYTSAITAEFGFARSEFTLYTSISAAIMMITSPIIGQALKKYNPQKVFVICIASQTIGYVGFTFCTQLWQFYLFAIFLGIGFAGFIRLGPATLVNLWFGPKLKGRAMAITTSATGFGAILLVPLVTKVVNTFGWHFGYYLTAAINLVVVIPTFWLIVRTPEQLGIEKQGMFTSGETKGKVEDDGINLTAKEALKTKEIWLLFAGQILLGIAATGVLSNVQLYYNDIGMNTNIAAWLAASATFFSLFGKFVTGWIAEKFGIKVTTLFTGICFAAAFLGLYLAQFNYYCAAIYTVCYALGNSMTILVVPMIVPTMFGSKNYSQIFGWVNMSSGIGTMIGPTSVAYIYDVAQTYSNAWIILGVMMLVITACYVSAIVLSNKRNAALKAA